MADHLDDFLAKFDEEERRKRALSAVPGASRDPLDDFLDKFDNEERRRKRDAIGGSGGTPGPLETVRSTLEGVPAVEPEKAEDALLSSGTPSPSQLYQTTGAGAKLAGRMAIHATGTILDKAQWLPPLVGMRAVTGAVKGAVESLPKAEEPKPITRFMPSDLSAEVEARAKHIAQRAWDSAIRKPGREVYGYDLAEEILPEGGDPGKRGRSATLGFAIDSLAMAPLARLQSGILGLTKAGRAKETFGEGFKALERLEAERAAAVAAGNQKRAAQLTLDIAKYSDESLSERAKALAMRHLAGSPELSRTEAYKILRAEKAAGKPTTLAPDWEQQAFWGERKLLPGMPTGVVNTALVGGLVRGAQEAAAIAKKTPVVRETIELLNRAFVHQSGNREIGRAEASARQTRAAVRFDLMTDLERISNDAKRRNMSPADRVRANERAQFLYEPQEALRPLHAQARGLIDTARGVLGDGIDTPQMETLQKNLTTANARLGQAKTPVRQQQIQDEIAELTRKVELLEMSPTAARLDHAKELLEQHPKLAKSRQGQAVLAGIDQLLGDGFLGAQRGGLMTPHLNTLKSGVRTLAADTPDVQAIAQQFNTLYRKVFEQETAGGRVTTPKLLGQTEEYVPVRVTEAFQEYLQRPDPISASGRPQSPAHTSQFQRDFREMTPTEINAEARTYAGKPVVVGQGNILRTDPFEIAPLRIVKSANAQAGAEFIDYVARKAHQPGTGAFLSHINDIDKKVIPEGTLQRLAGVEMPVTEARYVAQQLRKFTNPETLDWYDELLKAPDKTLMGWWKTRALSTPGRLVRDELGNVHFNFLMGDISRPQPYFDAWKFQRAAPEALARETFFDRSTGTNINKQQALKEAIEDGAYKSASKYGVEELGKTGSRSKFWGGVAAINPLGADNAYTNAIRKMGNFSQENAKLANYIENRFYRGMERKKAGALALKSQIDYAGATAFEEGVKRLIPFYMFTSRNLANNAELALRNPGKLAAEMNVVNAMALSGPPLTPEENLDIGMRGEVRAPLAKGYETVKDAKTRADLIRRRVDNYENYYPPAEAIETANSLFHPWGGDWGGKIVRGGHPWLKLGYELDSNWDTYRERPIDPQKASGRKVPRGFREPVGETRQKFLGMTMPVTYAHAWSGIDPLAGTVNRLLGDEKYREIPPLSTRVWRFLGKPPSSFVGGPAAAYSATKGMVSAVREKIKTYRDYSRRPVMAKEAEREKASIYELIRMLPGFRSRKGGVPTEEDMAAYELAMDRVSQARGDNNSPVK